MNGEGHQFYSCRKRGPKIKAPSGIQEYLFLRKLWRPTQSKLSREDWLLGAGLQFFPHTIQHPIHKMHRLQRRKLPRNL